MPRTDTRNLQKGWEKNLNLQVAKLVTAIVPAGRLVQNKDFTSWAQPATDSWPVHRRLTPSAEPLNHHTSAACFHNWPCWAIISPWREVMGVGFTSLLPWSSLSWKGAGKELPAALPQPVSGTWHGPRGGGRVARQGWGSLNYNTKHERQSSLRAIRGLPTTLQVQAGLLPFYNYWL